VKNITFFPAIFSLYTKNGHSIIEKLTSLINGLGLYLKSQLNTQTINVRKY